MARTFALLDHKCPELEKPLEEKRVSYEWFVCGCSPCERQYQVLEDGKWKDMDKCPFCKTSMTGISLQMTGDLYSSCPKCSSMDTKYIGTEAGDSIYECKKCGNHFFPHILAIQAPLLGPYPPLEGDIIVSKREVECPECGHKFKVE